MKALSKLIKLIGLPTPKLGEQLRKVGVGLIGGGSAGLVASTQLPEVPDSWMAFVQLIIELLSAITVIIGLFVTGAGSAQVKGDPDKL
jgi:hypothetical protein